MRIAIFGAGGMLGHTLYQVLVSEHPDTWAVIRKPAERLARFGLFDPARILDGVDARSEEAVHAALERIQPDAVLNAIGLTTRKLGGQKDSDIIVVNSALPHWLKGWCEPRGRRLVHFSTDCVFSGAGGPYAITDRKDAKDLYGQSKALGEVEGEGILTIRSSIVGLELEGRTELLEWLRSQRGRQINGFRQVLYSGVTTVTMAHVVRTLLARGEAAGGIHQLAGEPISKYNLARLTSEVFGLDLRVQPVDEPVSNKVLLPSGLFTSPELQPPSWRDQLLAVARDIPQHASWSNA